MYDRNTEAIFELFDLNNQSILCCIIDHNYISGLLKRGAIIWFREDDRSFVRKLDEYEKYKTELNFFNNDETKKAFNFSLVEQREFSQLRNDGSLIIGKHIVIISNWVKLLKWKSSNKLQSSILCATEYSVVPSMRKIKLIIPDQLEVKPERYWSLRNKNPYLTLKLICEWLFIKVDFLRKIFSDKLIIIKC